MESDWRYGVWDMFGPGTGFELTARFDDPLLNFLWVTKLSATQWGVHSFFALAKGEGVLVAGPFPIGPGDRFPFGQSVLPD